MQLHKELVQVIQVIAKKAIVASQKLHTKFATVKRCKCVEHLRSQFEELYAHYLNGLWKCSDSLITQTLS